MKLVKILIAMISLFNICACTHTNRLPVKIIEEKNMYFSPAWPHGEIEKVFENVFMVTGTNVIMHDDNQLQSSRNMVIVRQGHDLTLINTVRLNEAGLKKLDSLGAVKNIIRIGAFHGRDDAFYQNRYGAKLWAFSTMEFSHGEQLDIDLAEGQLPIKAADLIQFKITKFPEALILLHQDNGILITCDSIKNWTKKDGFFDDTTFALMKAAGSIGEAVIDETWLKAMKPSRAEIESLLSLKFSNLISAHGPPLLNRAKAAVQSSIQKLQ